jgi:Transposase DDE domain
LDQVVVAAELTQKANDLQQLAPMLAAIGTTLASAGIDARPPPAGSRLRLLVDRQRVGDPRRAGAAAPTGPPRPPRQAPQARPALGVHERRPAREVLAGLGSEQGKACYARRSWTIEPVFGQVKTVQGGGWFLRRGLRACAAEWKLLCGTHNLLKLWRTTTATSH